MTGETGLLLVILTEVRYHVVLLRCVDLVAGWTVRGLLVHHGGGRIQLLVAGRIHIAHQITVVLVRRLVIATVVAVRRRGRAICTVSICLIIVRVVRVRRVRDRSGDRR